MLVKADGAAADHRRCQEPHQPVAGRTRRREPGRHHLRHRPRCRRAAQQPATPSDLLRLGQTIVFDIFPCEAGGGYFYDFTRTWCLGYAPDEAQALYEDVLHASTGRSWIRLEPGVHCPEYQHRTCELFEAHGHPTIEKDPRNPGRLCPQPGSRGGAERPRAPVVRAQRQRRRPPGPGAVVTIEPGLYYPERGLGVRLEDTVWMRPDGKVGDPGRLPAGPGLTR